MKWEEVRKAYPNKWVKFQILKSHIENDTKYIDEIDLLGDVDEISVTKELFNSPKDILVYHTSKEHVSLKIRRRAGMRRVVDNENRI